MEEGPACRASHSWFWPGTGPARAAPDARRRVSLCAQLEGVHSERYIEFVGDLARQVEGAEGPVPFTPRVQSALATKSKPLLWTQSNGEQVRAPRGQDALEDPQP